MFCSVENNFEVEVENSKMNDLQLVYFFSTIFKKMMVNSFLKFTMPVKTACGRLQPKND